MHNKNSSAATDQGFNLENILVHDLLWACVKTHAIQHWLWRNIRVFQRFGERRMNLRLCLQLFLWTNNQKTLYLCIFEISTICSKHQADSTCVKYVQQKFAGTGLGSSISWILNLVLPKSANTCLIQSKHFTSKKGEFWSKVRGSDINPAPKLVYMNPHIPSPVWSIWLGAPVMGLCIKCLLDRFALTLPVIELHTLKYTPAVGLNPSTSFPNLKRCNSIRDMG